MTSDKNLKIAVVGPTQSGKTCLAVGLVSTNTSGFTIQSVDEDGRAYLVDLKADLRPTKDEQGNQRPGVWPDASNLGTNKPLRFDFLKKGKQAIRVGFPEYSGEMLQPDRFKAFANEHLRGLDGVVLLVNPGADAFQKRDQRIFEDYMAQYEHVLTFLRDPNNESDKAFVALTVTAADRISGDLKGKLDLFNECIQRLSNILNTSCFGEKKWKRFDVTITGHLKDQNQPTLASGRRNRASAPFLWLLDELNWRPIREEIFRKIRNISFVIAGAAALCGAACGVYAWNILKEIDREKTGLEQLIDKARNKDELNEITRKLGALQTRTGLFAEKAKSIASDIEPKVWNVFEREINKEINVIRGNPGKYGGDKDCSRVDTLFVMWQPKTHECKGKHAAKKNQWEKDKPDYQDQYAVSRMLEDVRTPLDKNVSTHGDAAIKLFYGLYAKLAVAKTIHEESQQQKISLLSDLDTRVEKEWREFAIPKFEAVAQSNATHEATHAFVTLLDEWPVSTNGLSAKVELTTSVSNSIPKWRTKYEMTHFSDMKGEALKNRSLEDLAKLYPARVVTNEYLTLAYVTEQWKNEVKGAYEKVYAGDITNFVNKVVERSRGGRPMFTSGDEAEIERKAATVGKPFDRNDALAEIRDLVAAKATGWSAQKRKDCEDWIRKEITLRPGRSGWDLVSAYRSEKSKHRGHEEIFNETIRSAVYRYCENCFEDDIAYFKENYKDKSNCEKRFNDHFKSLCREIVDKANDPDEVSWAIRFAKACVDTGHVKDGFGNAFQEEFEITSINGKIDYNGAKPLEGFLGTQFGVEVFRASNEAKPTTILERDKSPVVKINDNNWYVLSRGEGWKVYASFADPLYLGMKLRDDRNWESDYRRDYKDKDAEGFLKRFYPFDDCTSDEISIELGGSFGKQTKDRELAAYVQINMKRISGGGICVLLSRAKESQKVER